ncbi:MAG TPA: SIMPL domain-containing protein [Dehalococcoidia bacterium]|nr:SIMPL domain-containing protein [Dehalococcoidia bacterium]
MLSIKNTTVAAISAAMLLAAACAGGHATSIRTSQGLNAAPPVTAGAGVAQTSGGTTSSAAGAPALAPSTQGSQAALPQLAPAIAYPWYAPAQSQTGLTVVGFGQAQATADAATLTIYLGAQVVGGPIVVPNTGPNQPPQPTPISDADVQAVVDAIKGQGVADSDIRVDRAAPMATIAATVRHLDALAAIEQAAKKAADERGLSPSTNVIYSVTHCASLEQAAQRAAVSDANTRVSSLAGALNVSVGAIVGAGYTVYPAFGANACESGGVVPYPLANARGAAATAGVTPEIQLNASVTVTFAIK